MCYNGLTLDITGTQINKIKLILDNTHLIIYNDTSFNVKRNIMSKQTFVARVWTKKQTQQTLTALRQAGYTVKKISMGYKVTVDEMHVMTAMNGANGYLVRHDNQLFS